MERAALKLSASARSVAPVLAVVAIAGTGAALALLVPPANTGTGSTSLYDGRAYYSTTVTVPPGNTTTNPLVVAFHRASFSLGWVPQDFLRFELAGVNVTVLEPSGVLFLTGTGCGACGYHSASAFSPDATVGIAWTTQPGELGIVTLLVAVGSPT